jgi:molybdopterin-guanine dinucleotide biosynthesis protein A
VVDIIPGKGPLMGIYSGICASSSFVNFVIACDIPVINIPLLKELLSHSFLYDIVVPSFGQGTYEPLFAVYTKRIITPAKTLLDNDQRRVASLFSLCKTKIMETADKEWYTNLNTPQDYAYFIEKVPGTHL